MKNKYYMPVSFLSLILSLSLISALSFSNCETLGNCNQVTTTVSTSSSTNYSLVNVNNSLYWQGHTGTDGTWLTGILKQDGTTPLTGNWNYGNSNINGSGKISLYGNMTVINNVSSNTGAPLVLRNIQPYGASGLYNQYSQIWLDSSGTLMAYIRNDGTFAMGGTQGYMSCKGIINFLGSTTVLPVWNALKVDTTAVHNLTAFEVQQDDNDNLTAYFHGGTGVLFGGNVTINNSLNVTRNINAGGNITGNGIYGGMWYHNNTLTEIDFASDGVYYTLFMMNATNLNGFGAEGIGFGLNSNLTAQYAGTYQVSYMATGSGQNNHLYRSSIFVNGVNQELCGNSHKMTAGGDIITQSGICMISLAIGDKVSIRTADIGGTGTGNYYSSNLNLFRVGD
jgi:hypothetical protein